MVQVSIKHAGKKQEIEFDAASTRTGSDFKALIFSVTGVPPARMKVMSKSGILKDDADMKSVVEKVVGSGGLLTVLGEAGELPKAPKNEIVFMEDMTDDQLAEATRLPAGIVNEGNTCYLNASLQALRAIPELQASLLEGPSHNRSMNSELKLTSDLKNLYTSMSQTTESVEPISFLRTLREVHAQFSERDRRGGYAQQDAGEAYNVILDCLKKSGPNNGKDVVSRYMQIDMVKSYTCLEAPEEEAQLAHEKFFQLTCNISATTNYLSSGIEDSLKSSLEKNSPTLNRMAVYDVKSAVSRLPAYVTVQLQRFYWKQDINKKSKIMRKVKFPFELDLLDICAPELKEKLAPANKKLKEISKDRDQRANVRKRRKLLKVVAEETAKTDVSMDGTSTGVEGTSTVADGEIEDESVARKREEVELKAVLNEGLLKDIGASTSGLFELCGIVTHKGASADGGHYLGWVKKDVHDTSADEQNDEWWKFDDSKVSLVKQDKITGLEGGGEDSVAYLLMYRTKKMF